VFFVAVRVGTGVVTRSGMQVAVHEPRVALQTAGARWAPDSAHPTLGRSLRLGGRGPSGLLGEADNSLQYWLSRPPVERLAMVQKLRAEYHGWVDGTGPRIQRVCRVLRRT
jgi:hypothetical protein